MILKESLPANFRYYHLLGLASCLTTVFQFGNDFRNEGKAINRNFISHGMSERKVSKIDCLQLFLLYRNLLTFVDDFNEQYGGRQVVLKTRL